jgi:hypothetical protein
MSRMCRSKLPIWATAPSSAVADVIPLPVIRSKDAVAVTERTDMMTVSLTDDECPPRKETP